MKNIVKIIQSVSKVVTKFKFLAWGLTWQSMSCQVLIIFFSTKQESFNISSSISSILLPASELY